MRVSETAFTSESGEVGEEGEMGEYGKLDVIKSPDVGTLSYKAYLHMIQLRFDCLHCDSAYVWSRVFLYAWESNTASSRSPHSRS